MISMMKNILRRLLHIPEHKRIREHLLELPLASSSEFRTKIMKYIPYPAPEQLYVLQKSDCDDSEAKKNGLPIPPTDYLDGYGTAEAWLHYGKENIETMMVVLNSSNFFIESGNRILDFGCSSGRLIRWLVGLTEACEIWGVDISARQIAWCQENLTPPFNFATVTIMPHLPFEDRYFDLIYCGSVFTHIDDLAEAWLLELRRIMRPGGRLYITIHDKHTADLIINRNYPHSRDQKKFIVSADKDRYFGKTDYYKYAILPGGPESQVFYDVDYLCQRWGRILKILSVTPEAYFSQTAVLMEK